MKLTDKSAVITGGASGIGEASVRLFAREGADVTIADISPAGERLAADVRASGGRAAFVQTDVSSAAQLERLVQAHVERCGGIDVLFNNASWHGPGCSVAETREEDLDRVLATNFKSVFLACKLVGPLMAAAGKGSIINTSAGSAREGLAWPNLGAYIGAKGAVISFTRALAVELSPLGVRVNSLNPGITNTTMLQDFVAKQPDKEAFWAGLATLQLLKRIAEPEEIARSALFLASEDSAYVTGTDLLVDGGLVLG